MISQEKLMEIADKVCTEKEREAIELVFRQQLGWVRASRIIGISPRALRNRVDNARRKINQEAGTTP